MSEASARLSINVYVECPSRPALSSCSEIPNSSDHASRQAIECEPVAWLTSKGEEKEVMFDSEYDRNDRNHDEKRGWKYDPLFTLTKADDRISVHEYTARSSLEALKFYTEWMQRNACGDPEPIEHFYAMQAIEEIESRLPEPPKQEQGHE